MAINNQENIIRWVWKFYDDDENEEKRWWTKTDNTVIILNLYISREFIYIYDLKILSLSLFKRLSN